MSIYFVKKKLSKM